MGIKRLGPFQAGEQLGGLRGLADYLGQPDERNVRPTADELQVSKMQPGKPKPHAGASRLKRRFIQDDRELDVIQNIPKPSRQFVITPRLVGLASIRLDIGLTNRCDIAIWNVSAVAIWVNTSSSVAANAGVPLGPSAAGGFNGGAISADLSEEVRFYGIAAAGAQNLVIVMEASK